MQGKGLFAAAAAVIVIVFAIGALWLLPENEPSMGGGHPPGPTAPKDATTAKPNVAAPSHAVPPEVPADTMAAGTVSDGTAGQQAAPSDGSGAMTEKPAKTAKPDEQVAAQTAKPAESAGGPAAESAPATPAGKAAEGEAATPSTAQQGTTTGTEPAAAATQGQRPETGSETGSTEQMASTGTAEQTGSSGSSGSGQAQSGEQGGDGQVAVMTPPKQPVPSAKPGATPPSFDVVRISRQCTAVIAGRAEPGAQVTVWDDDQPLGQVVADANGEWVLVVSKPMRSGSRQLKLIAVGADARPVESESVVVIAVPDCTAPAPAQKKEQESVIAVLTPKEGGTSKVLQAPPPEDEASEPKGLALNSVDYDDKGEVVLSGKAEPGQNVQAYVDNKPVGAAQADKEGRWEVKPEETIEPGIHKLRVDQVAHGGKVAARIELPFSRAHASQIVLAPGHVVVQPGNSLWRIARRTYGHGLRYTVIYQANQGQIRDPDLIYPGQIFSLPRVN